MTNQIPKFERKKKQIEQAQFVFSLDHHTLLSLDLAAGAIGRAVSTLRCDVTRRPSSLPKLTRLGGRVFVRVEDLLKFINPAPTSEVPVPAPRRRGCPSKVEQMTRGAA
jgi:hypothetical protein